MYKQKHIINGTKQDDDRLRAVQKYADNVLKECMDCYRENPVPLFVNEILVHTKTHRLKTINGEEIAASNLAHQQNFMRTLVGLSNLTGEAGYAEAAKKAFTYYFNNLQEPSGLIQWGGHRILDLKTLSIKSPAEKNMAHELKNNFPYYELMYEINPMATEKYIKAVWNAHVYDWSNLEINRHGRDVVFDENIWDKPFANPEPFRETKGLSFMNIGNDLIYSACMLYKLTGDKDALVWGKRLAEMYVKARHPLTKLGVYQYTQPKKEEVIDDDSITLSKYGDRAKRQFGPEFGDVALEGNVILMLQACTIYGTNALMEMDLAERLGEPLSDMLEWVHEGLSAFARFAYVKDKNIFKPLLADGTDLTGYVLPRDGYYGKAGTKIEPIQATGRFLYSYERCACLTKDMYLWNIACNIARSIDLGYLGSEPGKDVQINSKSTNDDVGALYAMLDLYRVTGNTQYIELARLIGNNIINNKFHYGYFLRDAKHLSAHINAPEPLALMTLEAVLQGDISKVPQIIYAG